MVAMLGRSLRVAALVVLGFPGLGQIAVDAQTAVKSINIETGWGGLGEPQHALVTIRNDHGLYRVDGKRIDSASVESLVRSLQAPQIARPEMANLGVTAEWLDAHLAIVKREMPWTMDGALPSQVQLFEGAFRDPKTMAGPVADRFTYGSLDDYPYASVQVVLQDGTTLSAATHSYYAFMIPWTLKGRNETWNADISRAVSALLPPKTPDKDRLAGAGFDQGLAEALMSRIQDRWKMLGVEGRAGTTLTVLRQHYTVERADINPYHDAYFGKRWQQAGAA